MDIPLINCCPLNNLMFLILFFKIFKYFLIWIVLTNGSKLSKLS